MHVGVDKTGQDQTVAVVMHGGIRCLCPQDVGGACGGNAAALDQHAVTGLDLYRTRVGERVARGHQHMAGQKDIFAHAVHVKRAKDKGKLTFVPVAPLCRETCAPMVAGATRGPGHG